MQVRLEIQLQTHEIVPILAHAQQHYWELNIIVACSNWGQDKVSDVQLGFGAESCKLGE